MTQKEFYRSPMWRKARQAYIDKRLAIDGGMCEVCGNALGKVVHHIRWLDDITCNDPTVALAESNLRYECQDCHNKEQSPNAPKKTGRVRFDANGNIFVVDDY